MAKCRYCGKEVTWMKDGRKNVPVESDGATHMCENYLKAKSSFKEYSPQDIDPEVLKQYQDRMNETVKKKK